MSEGGRRRPPWRRQPTGQWWRAPALATGDAADGESNRRRAERGQSPTHGMSRVCTTQLGEALLRGEKDRSWQGILADQDLRAREFTGRSLTWRAVKGRA
jgi:hypothetical protein